jgi:hypothetical protein
LLRSEERKALALELTPITAQGFMRDVSTSETFKAMYQDVYDHVIGCEKLTIFRKSDASPIAFVAAGLKKFEGLKIYHLEGIILLPKMQNGGFGEEILRKEIDESGANILAFHTQSMLMEKLGLKIAEFDMALAKAVASLIGTGNFVDLPDGPIDKGRYGGQALYGDIKKFDSIAIKKEGFNYLKGDAMVFAGRVKPMILKN